MNLPRIAFRANITDLSAPYWYLISKKSERYILPLSFYVCDHLDRPSARAVGLIFFVFHFRVFFTDASTSRSSKGLLPQ